MTADHPPALSGYQDYQDTPWITGFYRPLLTAALATSITAGPVALLRTLNLGWPLGYILPLAFLISAEGIFSTRQLGRPNWRDRRGLAFRLGELALILTVIRLAVWAWGTGWPGAYDFLDWLRSPATFFDLQFVTIAFWLAVAWGLAVAMTGDFAELAIRPDEVAAHESHDWGESASRLRAFFPVPRGEIAEQFVVRWMLGGLFLILCIAATQVTISTGDRGLVRLGLAGLGVPHEILAATLCYFWCGLLLLSEVRLALLRGRWYNQGIEIARGVIPRWRLNAVLAVAAVAVLGALLPIGTTSWLSRALETVLAVLMRLGYLLIMLLIMLLSLLLLPLRALAPDRTAPVRPPDLQVPTQAQAISRLPDWLGGAVLWSVVGAVVIYLLLNYLRAHGLFGARLGDILRRLRFWWRARWARITTAAQAIAVALGDRLRPLRPTGPALALRRAIRFSRLAPRDQVRYFYLLTVRRAAEHGLDRQPHQTPLEFSADMKQQWPDAEPDVGALTEAFLGARYDRRPVVAAEAEAARSVWRRVMRALRGKAPLSGDKGEKP